MICSHSRVKVCVALSYAVVIMSVGGCRVRGPGFSGVLCSVVKAKVRFGFMWRGFGFRFGLRVGLQIMVRLQVGFGLELVGFSLGVGLRRPVGVGLLVGVGLGIRVGWKGPSPGKRSNPRHIGVRSASGLGYG